jgi:hypothetical protein
MLAFDIETEGLDSRYDQITVASTYDPAMGISRTYNFLKDPARFQSERDEFIRALDEAESLCCFNGVRFDIPFIAKRFRIPKEQHGKWVLKTFDFYEVCKLCLGSSCSLNNLLMTNGYEVKSSSGMQAVKWAKEKNWKSLEEYCMNDAILTYEISMTSDVTLPLTRWPNNIRVACARKSLGDDHNPVLTGAASLTNLTAQCQAAADCNGTNPEYEAPVESNTGTQSERCEYKRKRPPSITLPQKSGSVSAMVPGRQPKKQSREHRHKDIEPWPCIHLVPA